MMRSILAVFTGLVALTLLTDAIEAATTPLLMNAFPNALPTEEAIQRNVPELNTPCVFVDPEMAMLEKKQPPSE